jgi:ATP-dependent helicase/nuclease subunit A
VTAAEPTLYTFPRNLVLAASAGTGKTHALVGVAIHLLMGGCRAADGGLRPPMPPEQLLATTFSRKAAGEIRDRIHAELERLALGDAGAAYRATLLAACDETRTPRWTDAELAQKARAALARLPRATIGTLHSFATRLVRAHALAAGVGPDFEVPDEETSRERAEAAIARVLEARAHDPAVRAVVRLAGGSDAFAALVMRLLDRMAEDGLRARDLSLALDDAERIDGDFRELISLATKLTRDDKLGERARAVLVAWGREGHAGLESAVSELFAVPNRGKKSPEAAHFFEYRALAKEAIGGENLGQLGVSFVRRHLCRDLLVPRAEALRSLLGDVEEEMRVASQRDSVLTFAEVLRAARDLCRDHPAIAREVGRELSALLVDEFQDTSGVQRDLVLLLWERGAEPLRAAGVVPAVSDLRGEGLLVVGDRKQSIYGFRGADVAVFAELAVGLAGADAREALSVPSGLVSEPATPSADFVALVHNRRGEPPLLAFANAASRVSLVPEAYPAELYEVDYAPATEDLLSPRGVAEPDSLPHTVWLRLPIRGNATRSTVTEEAAVIAARIARVVGGHEALVRGAPATYRDIAVLADRHHMLDAVAHALGQAGIPYVALGMGFYGTREVRDMTAMLACLVDPEDSLCRAEVLRGPWVGVSDRTLIGLTEPGEGLVDVGEFEAGARRHLIDTDDVAPLMEAAAVIASLRRVVGRIGPGAALRHAVRALELREVMQLLPRGRQRAANVDKLLVMADAESDGHVLLRRLRRAAAAEEKEGEAAVFSDEDDAVRLLTTHASKGLAFPVVFIPEVGAAPRRPPLPAFLVHRGAHAAGSTLVLRAMDAEGDVHVTPSYARASRDERRRGAAEARRLRYVGMTRACTALYYVGDRALPKASRATYDATMAGLLARLADDDGARAAAHLAVEVVDTERTARAVVAESDDLGVVPG